MEKFEEDAKAVVKGGMAGYFKPGGTKKLYAGTIVPAVKAAEEAKGATNNAFKSRDKELDAQSKAKGGSIKRYAKGGGIEIRGKTKGKFI